MKVLIAVLTYNCSSKIQDPAEEIIKLDTLTLDLMGNEGRKNVLNRFNIEKMCFNTYSEYKKLIN